MRSHTATMLPDVREAVENGSASGTWSEVFGPIAEEIFSAFHVSSYVNHVAERGRAEYALPLFANAWLAHEGKVAGEYPSGGPYTRVHEVWRYCAPTIDILCPDIYVPNFLEVCDDYSRNHALFIPESATHSYAASRLAYCIGHYHAMGYSPFGFDDIGQPFGTVAGFFFGMDVTDPALNTPQDAAVFSWMSKTLNALMPLIAPKYGTRELQAACAERLEDPATLDFGKFQLKAAFKNHFLPLQGNGVAVAIQLSEEEFYLIGYQTVFEFVPGDAEHLDILVFEEGTFVDGQWVPGRRLNGDESTILFVEEPTLFRLKIHTYDNYQ